MRLLLASIITGLVSGILVIIYDLLTRGLQFVLFMGHSIEEVDQLPWWYLYLIPFVAILIVNYMIEKNEIVKAYGVLEIANIVEKHQKMYSLKDLLLKMLASSLSLASGFAVGNEGPSTAIGALVAHQIHHALQLPKKLIRLMLSIGASSALAAVFVSPITAIMFAIENIAYEFVKNYIGYIILGSLVAFNLSYHILDSLVFEYSAGKFMDMTYIIATFLFIPFMTFFVYFYLIMKDIVLKFLNNAILHQFRRYRNLIFAIIGGGVIGSLMIISPYAVFSGHELVKGLINNTTHFSLAMIFVLVVLRIIATTISMYANAVGGVFVAFMSIGALMGYGFGEIAIYLGLDVEAFYFAAIGASVFVGVNMKLPLTAIVMALEITYDYNVIVPTGFSVAIISYIVSLNFDIKKLLQ
ncbi:MAG: chloride channel protein [Epsilonproteobacteria bacterium]|nr:chloride channel protein [Campylobacterota bacterium]